MPPKKPFQRNNKKKSGKKSLVPPADGAAAVAAFAQLDIDSESISSNTRTKPSSNEDRTGGRGLYGVYKRATQRFKEGLMNLVPSEIFAKDRVQTIMDAVDYLVSHQQKIDAQVLDDCRVSLQFRQSYSKYFEDGGDEGHGYFILVLGYCYRSLKPLVPQIKKRAVSEKATEKRFRFTDLDVDSEGEEEEEDKVEDDDSSSTPVRPQEPDVEFTIDDLVESTDRCQACLFLYNVEKCMKVVADQFSQVKKKACFLRDKGIDDPSMLVGPIITAAAATNFCIRQVQIMDEELKFNLPHLSTFYRVLACVSFKSGIDHFEVLLKRLGKKIPRFEVTSFAGDVVELAYRLPEGMMDRLDVVVRDFCEKWLLPFTDVKDLAGGILIHAMLDTRPIVAKPLAEKYPEMPASYEWMSNVTFIGGDRSILNTQSLIQQTAKMFESYPPIIFAFPGAYGTQWDEQKCPAQKIRGDMDQLLMEDIVPELMYSSLIGHLCHDIPRIDELLPFVKLLKDYVSNPTKPVPLALAFGFHAILTSIFEIQGDDDVATIAKAAKNSYDVYFKQLDQLLADPDFGKYGVWPNDLNNMIRYQRLALPIDKSEQRFVRATWNPFRAGMFLNYVAFNINVGGGAPIMNRLEQLRMILHLRNAFQQRDVWDEEIPILAAMDNYFETIQYLWGGEKPKRESMVKKFWISYGLKAEVIRDVHEDCRRFVIDKKPSSIEQFLEIRTRVQTAGGGRTKRDLADCHPHEISQSFRKICLGEFDAIANSNESIQQVNRDDLEWNMKYARFLNNTVATMVDEEELISWNLASLGCCLSGFMRVLCSRLGWDEDMEDLVANMCLRDSERRRKTQRRGAVKADNPDSPTVYEAHAHSVILTMNFVNRLLGRLEFLDSVESDLVIVAARDCMVEYFSALDPSKYKIFNVFASDRGCEQDATDSTPRVAKFDSKNAASDPK